AGGVAHWAAGADQGGRLRHPASFCGVVGFKPTIGTVDTEGVVPLSRTLDTLGPLAPDVAAAARALEMVSYLTGLLPERPRPLPALRIAVPRGWGGAPEPGARAAWATA